MAVAIEADDVFLTNSTVTLNTSSGPNSGAIDANGAKIDNTIVSGNLAALNPQGTDIVASLAEITFSLIGDLQSNPSQTLSSNNQFSRNPGLGPLQTNGGATFTHALLNGSRAIDGGRNALAINEAESALLTDQRGTGFARISGSRIDIGAFEAGTQPVFDFGDAPSTFPVLLANDGARHAIGSLKLGLTVDSENDGRASATSAGDRVGDDGVIMLTSLVAIVGTATTSSLSVNASEAGKLDAWIDFNRDGDWNDAGEQILVSADLSLGDNLVSFTVPAAANTSIGGNTAARFRFSSVGKLAPTGAAADGEVEDYLAVIVAGSSTAALRIDVPGGNTNVVVEGENLVVRQGTTIISRVPFTSFGELNLNGTSIDEILELAILNALDNRSLVIDGGLGKDLLKLSGSGQTLDLTNAKITLQEVEGVDVSGTGNNRLVITIDALKNISASSDTLEVDADAGDTIEFGDGWKAENPKFINGRFTHIVSEGASGGTARVELRNDRPLTNPLTPFDVDRDGRVQALDALRIINGLNRLGTGALAIPTNDSEIELFYFDVTGDLELTALDALRVINEINRLESVPNVSGEAVLASLSSPSSKHDELVDDFEFPATVDSTTTKKEVAVALIDASEPASKANLIDDFFKAYDDEERQEDDWAMRLLSGD